MHEHTNQAKLLEVIDWVRQGKRVAYASDAGTPNVNDPGGKLAAAAYETKLNIETIPGPSALTAAMAVCGFPMDDFIYRGFVPHKKGRKKFFSEIVLSDFPVIFLESTHRINKSLNELSLILGTNRLIFIGREMTKLHETYYRGTVEEVKIELEKTSTKGEFVVIVGPKPKL
ncbi:MAG: ribosomal RNA small subunit methyltransferase I [Patescibacteria group bacterium]